ncbi:15068_t:CDS:1, partial [Dentiscutata heterogama]
PNKSNVYGDSKLEHQKSQMLLNQKIKKVQLFEINLYKNLASTP